MDVTLCLSGGAARGAFHLGVLQAADDLHITIRAISGSSIGAAVGAAYAAGVTPKEQLEHFKSHDFKRSIRFNYFKNSLFRIDADAAIYDALLPKTTFEELDIALYITAVDLNSGTLQTLQSGSLKTAVMASTALTPLFQPIAYREMLLVDGGFLDNFPLHPLQRYQLPTVGVNTMPVTPKQPRGIWKISKRALFMLSQSAVLEKIDRCHCYITSAQLSRYRLFSLQDLDALFELGYRCGHEELSLFIASVTMHQEPE